MSRLVTAEVVTRADILAMARTLAPKWTWYGWRTEVRGYLNVDCSCGNDRRNGSTGTIRVLFRNGQWEALGERARWGPPRDTLAAALRQCLRAEQTRAEDDAAALRIAREGLPLPEPAAEIVGEVSGG